MHSCCFLPQSSYTGYTQLLQAMEILAVLKKGSGCGVRIVMVTKVMVKERSNGRIQASGAVIARREVGSLLAGQPNINRSFGKAMPSNINKLK